MFVSFVPSKRVTPYIAYLRIASSATGPKNALKCIRTFPHYFFAPCASTHAELFAENLEYKISLPTQNTEVSSSPLDILILLLAEAGFVFFAQIFLDIGVKMFNNFALIFAHWHETPALADTALAY